jgi:hypothetical protein
MGEGYAVMGVVGMIDSACCIQSSDTSDRAFAAPDTFLAKKKGFFGCGLACSPLLVSISSSDWGIDRFNTALQDLNIR